MAYNPANLEAKLNQITETQDSIASISQWILFHKRHAAKSAETWAKFITQCPENLKLGLVYVANEVVQQAKIKQRNDFVDAWGQVLPNTIGEVYSQVPSQIQDRITRVINVWKDRKVFNSQILGEIDSQIGSSSFFGGPKPSNSAPAAPSSSSAGARVNPEIQQFVDLYSKLQTLRPPKLLPSSDPAQVATNRKIAQDAQKAAKDQLSIVNALMDQIETLSGSIEDKKSRIEANLTSLNDILIGMDDQDDELPSPEIEADSDHEPQVYTAKHVKEDDEEEPKQPEKQARVDLDPKLAAFLANINQ